MPDCGRAAALREGRGEAMWQRGELPAFRRLMDALPADVRRRHPFLIILRAWTQYFETPYHPEATDGIIREAEDALRESPTGNAETRGLIAALRGSIAGTRQDVDQIFMQCEQALALLPPDKLLWRIYPT